MPRPGVLIVGFGGPDSPEAVGPFMCNLMGREPSPDLVARVRARYELIGGVSPLLLTAQDLADGVAVALASADDPMPVEVGMRYWHPSIAEAVAALACAGVEVVVMVSLSPYEAAVTHGEYRAAAEAASSEHPGMRVLDAPLLSGLPSFLDLQAASARAAVAELDAPSAPLVFTAHSLPLEDVARDDSYVRGLEAAADEVAARLGLGAGAKIEVFPGVEAFGSVDDGRTWLVAYQSQGARGGAWLGPDLHEVIDSIALQGLSGVAVVPLGFATDHMETCHDLDVIARARATDAGLLFSRSDLPNAHPALAAGIARAVRDVLASP